ncbi:MAG: LytTR family transcriptional regulator [Flavobacterium sp.]|nr:LytTR family transcriptional regulator [Flavobacterium sp.]
MLKPESIQAPTVNDEVITLLKTELSELKEAIIALANHEKPIVDSEAITKQLIKTLQEALPKETPKVDLEPILSEIKNITIESPKAIVASDEIHRNLICIKSYGDYRFLELDEITFLKADNNSTDITLHNGEVITAFKTLKYFEENLPVNFFRIHNSYIVNKNYVSRVHTGNTVCYIKNTKTQLPFSKSYKENVEQIIAQLAGSEFKDI